ncbi:branched-chain amino acid ABC transporter permease [Nocardioides sp. Y6]|uniref:Branched-chain amino acid ABC transporter permease n=1 Tax=Nocardioides malaquae TaxID=2773426 RepID=A0ABR9RU84_9ACTN|nr:branched-chain amino acid ABC transporter permease [Nocardioides malaquae]MBE7324752.1 branched-chain amino acid ABC transporter permease [Nocardioides malaquae]
MSEATHAHAHTRTRTLNALKGAGLVVAAILVILAPSVAGTWLPALMNLAAYAVGVVGFNLLYSAGQLSLGHAFFMGLGGFSYAYLAGPSTARTDGLELDPLLAFVLSALLVGVVGLAFSPLTSRLGGLSLAAATLGLVFLGAHLFGMAERVTGGTAGRVVENIRFGEYELYEQADIWYFVAGVAAICFAFAALVSRSRVGLALEAIRDGEHLARGLGINVRRYKAQAFFFSSLFAGISGILIGLVAGVLVKESFSLILAMNILMMAILGGASAVVVGAVVGSALFVLLPEFLRRYGDALPFLAPEGAVTGLTPAAAATYVFGAAIILVLIVEPDGLSALGRRIRHRIGRARASRS